MSTTPPLWTPAFVRLTAAHFLQALGFSSMILLPRYLDAIGATRAEVGAVMGAAAIGGLATRPIVGWSLDGPGRKPTLFVGTLALTAGMAMLGLVEQVGLVAYVARALAGVGLGALFTGYFTMASDLVPEARRTEGLALFGISGLVPLVVNPIAARAGVDAMAVRWFLPCVSLLVLSSLVLVAGVPEPPHRRPTVRPTLGAIWTALRHRSLWSVWVANVVFSGLVALAMAFALVVAQGRGIANAADLWFAYALGAVIVRVGGGTIPDRVGNTRILAVALGSYVSGVGVLAMADGRALLLLAGFLFGVGHGWAFPILGAQTVTRSPVETRGTALATFTGMWDATTLLAPPILGAVADVWGDVGMLLAACGVSAVGIVAWAALEVTIPSPAEA